MYKINYVSFIKKGDTDLKEGNEKPGVCYTSSPLGDIEKELNHNLGMRTPKEIGEIRKIKIIKGFILEKKP
jgi:hypothetical protein